MKVLIALTLFCANIHLNIDLFVNVLLGKNENYFKSFRP